MGVAEMDEIADMIVATLTATSAASAASGQLSRARYAVEPGVADAVRGRARELLSAHPLYPQIALG
jgi:glycine hydroxymethyltransferase